MCHDPNLRESSLNVMGNVISCLFTIYFVFFRCHAVIQGWQTETCHCVYANRTYTIERDDRQWKKDLEEAKKFLIENGY